MAQIALKRKENFSQAIHIFFSSKKNVNRLRKTRLTQSPSIQLIINKIKLRLKTKPHRLGNGAYGGGQEGDGARLHGARWGLSPSHAGRREGRPRRKEERARPLDEEAGTAPRHIARAPEQPPKEQAQKKANGQAENASPFTFLWQWKNGKSRLSLTSRGQDKNRRGCPPRSSRPHSRKAAHAPWLPSPPWQASRCWWPCRPSIPVPYK